MAKEQQLVFEAVTSTMKQLKGSYSIISLIAHVRCSRASRVLFVTRH